MDTEIFQSRFGACTVYCIVVASLAAAFVTICPIPVADMLVAGFAGVTVAGYFAARRIVPQIIWGIAAGFVAILISFAVSSVATGSVPILISNWWDVLWLTALLLWTLPGILLAVVANRTYSGITISLHNKALDRSGPPS